MICPKCNKDMLSEEDDPAGKTETVVCSYCGFKASPLEYHAWKSIQEKTQPNRKMVFSSGRFLKSQESTNAGIPLEEIKKTWESIRVPILVLVFMLMLLLVIAVARR